MQNIEFAYIRVSTKHQSYDRQLELLKQRVPDIESKNIFCEKQSGASLDKREELKRLLSILREGDVVYVHSIDRLGRNLLDILNIVKTLDEKKVRLISLSQNIDSFTPTGKMFIMICGMMAEIELILIKERVAEGVKRATKNHKMGRPKRTLSEVETEILDDYIDGRKTVSSCIALLKISRSTFFRRLQEYKDGKTLTNKGANTAKEKGIGEVIYG
ncbi:recombinase family protein [Candidatus Ventrimonas sp. KK005]|jgi:Site-specific recombinases, DNA invertase Pin homologs